MAFKNSRSEIRFAWHRLFTIILIFIFGCSANNYYRGLKELDKDSLQEAVNYFQEAEKENPNNYKIKRDLGVAYYKSQMFDEALLKLQEAKELKPHDGKTIFYLGVTYEAKKMDDQAIEEYKSYQQVSRYGGFRKQISKRIKQLNFEKVTREVKSAISNESNLNAASIPENTIAVLDFKNLSTNQDLNPLQKGLAQILLTDLAKVKKITVLERLRLNKLLEEIELGGGELVANESAPRVGKLLGARKIVQGGFTDLSDQDIRIDASLTETATTMSFPVEEIEGKLEAIFNLEKELAFNIIDELGIELSKEEREAIQKIPTESLLAFIAYSKGLDYEDQGMFDEAEQEYKAALTIDPGFDLAQDGIQELEITKSAMQEPMIDMTQFELQFNSSSTVAVQSSRISRLITTSVAAQTGQTPQGDNDTREPVQEDSGSDNVTSSTATVPIRIPLPSN